MTETEAAAIRSAFERGGELSAAVELRRLFPGVTDTAKARECARAIAGWKPLLATLRPIRPRPGTKRESAFSTAKLVVARVAPCVCSRCGGAPENRVLNPDMGQQARTVINARSLELQVQSGLFGANKSSTQVFDEAVQKYGPGTGKGSE